ncbi:MAG: carboxypeptidase regulatory-like domain-containing protein [Deltaproteobacteria bacterium]|nr:carboxypeptidase regulatory-like domain-containing protein [Deltaproteobacteria bacterium]
MVISKHFLLAILSLAVINCKLDYNNPIENKPVGTIRGKLVATPSEATAAFTAKPTVNTTALKFSSSNTAALEATQAVVGAQCTLEGTNYTATSDNNGEFELKNVPIGAYILICRDSERAYLAAVEVKDGQVNDIGTVEITPTGKIQGIAKLYNATDHTGITVFIAGTSYSATTDIDGAYLLTGVPRGVYELRFEKDGYWPATVKNIVVTSQATTLAKDVSLGLSTGPYGSISINNDAKYSTNLEVSLTFTNSDNASLMMLSESEGFTNAKWANVINSTNWTFVNEGSKQLYLKYADANGLESPPIKASIIIDTAAPVLNSLVINDGVADWTTNSVIQIAIDANDTSSGVTSIRIGNSSGSGSWVDFAEIMNWSLPTEQGQKTIYVTVRDAVGYESAEETANIYLDNDECSPGTSSCDPNANCINTKGAYICTCKDNWFGDGASCKEMVVEAGPPITFSDIYYLDIAINPSTQRPHLAYSSQDTGVWYITKDEANEWTDSIIVSPDVKDDSYKLSLDTIGKPHLIYSIVRSDDRPLLYASFDGDSWDTELINETATIFTSDFSLAFDKSDNPHIVYKYNNSDFTISAYNYIKRINNEWSVSTIPEIEDVLLNLMLDNEDNPHIIHMAKAPEANYSTVSHSYYNGTDWQKSSATNFIWEPIMSGTIDNTSTVHMCFRREPHQNIFDIVYLKYFNSTWEEKTLITQMQDYPRCWVTVDKANNPYLFYTDGWPGEIKYILPNRPDHPVNTLLTNTVNPIWIYMTFNKVGEPYILFYDVTDYEFKYAHVKQE